MLGVSSQESDWSCICMLVVSSQESDWSCICMLGVSSQESDRSCICMLGVSSQESDRSCISMLGVSILHLSTILVLDFGTVSTILYFLFSFYYHWNFIKITYCNDGCLVMMINISNTT